MDQLLIISWRYSGHFTGRSWGGFEMVCHYLLPKDSSNIPVQPTSWNSGIGLEWSSRTAWYSAHWSSPSYGWLRACLSIQEWVQLLPYMDLCKGLPDNRYICCLNLRRPPIALSWMETCKPIQVKRWWRINSSQSTIMCIELPLRNENTTNKEKHYPNTNCICLSRMDRMLNVFDRFVFELKFFQMLSALEFGALDSLK